MLHVPEGPYLKRQPCYCQAVVNTQGLSFLCTKALLFQLALLVQDQLHQKDGPSIYPVIDIKKRGILGTSLLGKLTLPKSRDCLLAHDDGLTSCDLASHL